MAPITSLNNSCSFLFQSSSLTRPKVNSILIDGPPNASSANLIRASKGHGISESFSILKQKGKVALIPYITAGDPDLSTTAKALKLLDSCGADLIELGLPFSDPILDGPVIQASHKRALKKNGSIQAIFSMLKEVTPQISCPITIFSYYNLILKYSIGDFVSAIKESGARGLLVPDLPLEESKALRNEVTRNGVDLVLLTTPTNTQRRMKTIAGASQGFVYLVSCTGVTGMRSAVNAQVEVLLKELKKETTKPVAVGFGISKPEHVRQLSQWGADGVIVGSAMVKQLGEANSAEEGLENLETFTRSLKAALP